VFVRNGQVYKGKRNGLQVKVTGIKVEFEILTENGQPLKDGRTAVEMWKFRKDFEDTNPSAEYLPPPSKKPKKEKTTNEQSSPQAASGSGSATVTEDSGNVGDPS